MTNHNSENGAAGRTAGPGPSSGLEVVIGCRDLGATVDFFVGRLGFRLLLISPADGPRVAVVEADGTRIRLVAGDGEPSRLRLGRDRILGEIGDDQLIGPNGTVIEVVDEVGPELSPPDPSLVVVRAADGVAVPGRAGMRYRDLLPGRQGGRFIVSHITIPDGGRVPDYVHHHDIRFQLIFCHRGRVRVVYEDQGQPFELGPGDCVLQPPGIRHRVLSGSPGLEVIEVSSPAEHTTFTDHDMSLPTPSIRPDRRFGGQSFVHHRAAAAAWSPVPGSATLDMTDTGVAAATNDLAAVRVLRARDRAAQPTERLDPIGAELDLHVILDGAVTLVGDNGSSVELVAGDAVSLPPHGYALADWSEDARLLEVVLPAFTRC